MSTTIQYTPKGVCSRGMNITLSDSGIIEHVVIIGGCDGNLSGISQLVVGMSAQEVVQRLQDVRCNGKATSCPHQLTIALQKALVAQDQ